jgi:hypothetical protein
MIYPEITVTLTLDDIKLYDRAREVGLPSIVVSMYGDRIKKLLAEERSTEREACAKICEKHADTYEALEKNQFADVAWSACIDICDAIRARGRA